MAHGSVMVVRTLTISAGGVGTSVGKLMIRELGRRHWVKSRFGVDVGSAISVVAATSET